MIKPSITTSVRNDANYKKFLKELGKIKGSYVSIGIQEDAGDYDSGTSVVAVGFWNEFGTEDIPSRPFIRSTLEAHKNELEELRQSLLKKVLNGDLTIEKGLETIGFRVREWIKATILQNDFQANAPSTAEAKRRKGVAPKPLLDTRLLLRSIEYKVVVK